MVRGCSVFEVREAETRPGGSTGRAGIIQPGAYFGGFGMAESIRIFHVPPSRTSVAVQMPPVSIGARLRLTHECLGTCMMARASWPRRELISFASERVKMRARAAHLKTDFGRTACTPQLPSTIWEIPKSTATDINEMASSSDKACAVMRNRRILRKASFMARSIDDLL